MLRTILISGVLFLSASFVSSFAPNLPVSSLYSESRHVRLQSTTILFNAIQQTEDAYLKMAMQCEGPMMRPDVVYVIMYNPGTEQEGIHTMEREDSELLLVFESIEEVNSFANLLREDPNWSQEPVPMPTPLDQMELACQKMGLPIKIVPGQG